MGKYIVKRIGIGFITIFMLLTITFFLTRWMPGNPFQSENISENVLQALEKEYGLDKPLLTQYGTYLCHFLQGNLGYSYKKPGVAVNEVIGRTFPQTMLLGSLAVMTALLCGMGIGFLHAKTSQRWVSRACLILECIGMGIPNFMIALVLLLIFGVQWRLLPTVGLNSPAHFILPVLSLAIYPMATIARYTYRNVSVELKREYVTFARMKGVKTPVILYRHVLRNVFPQILNYLGPTIAFLLTGSFVVESIYTIPGLGREFVNAISNRDYTMIMGLTVFMGVLVIGIQIIIDIINAWLDPRVRLSFEEK